MLSRVLPDGRGVDIHTHELNPMELGWNGWSVDVLSALAAYHGKDSRLRRKGGAEHTWMLAGDWVSWIRDEISSITVP